jgi:hypothetical protein
MEKNAGEPPAEARAPAEQRAAPPGPQRRQRAMRQQHQHRDEGDAEELRVAGADVQVVADGEERSGEQRPGEAEAEHAAGDAEHRGEADGADRDVDQLPGEEGVEAQAAEGGVEEAEQQVAVVVAERRRHRVEVEGAVPGRRGADEDVAPVLEDGERDDGVVAVAQQQGEAVGDLAAEEEGEAERAAEGGGDGAAPRHDRPFHAPDFATRHVPGRTVW